MDELCALTHPLLPTGQRHDLAAARLRVAEDRFNVVVLGEFKRGKSTLINALMERDALPVGVVPLTSIVTVIAAADNSPERLVVRFADGREHERPLDELEQYVTESRNPGSGLRVELARLALDHELLHAGLELIDTPGIGSIHGHNTAVARSFLPQVDAALCVLDASQPLLESEREPFAEAVQRVPRLLMDVNKIDPSRSRGPPGRTRLHPLSADAAVRGRRPGAVRGERPRTLRDRAAEGPPATARG